MNKIFATLQMLALRLMGLGSISFWLIGSWKREARPLYLLTACALVMSGCYSSSSVPEPMGADGLQDPGLHAIMTQNIERHIDRLDYALAGARDDVSIRENTAGIIQSTQGLQLSADVIMTLRSTLPLSADAANIYVERATELKGFASELEALARAGRINELRPIVAQVNASCNSCHQLFRAP